MAEQSEKSNLSMGLMMNHDPTPKTELDNMVKDTLESSGKYIYIGKYKEGGTRNCYLANLKFRGMVTQKRYVVKIDKPDSMISSPRAREHIDRGYDNLADLMALTKLPHPEKHHLASIHDFLEAKSNDGGDILLMLEDYFDGSITLDREVEVERGLSYPEFYQVFEQVTDAVRYLNKECKMYHRDLKPSNILVRRSGTITIGSSNLEVLITDLANSCRIGETNKKTVPTAGGHLVTNPFLFGTFTGHPGEYDERSELYAIGANMYYALTGNYMFDCDPFEGRAEALVNGKRQNLLNRKGHINERRFIKAINKNLNKKKIGDRWVARTMRNCLLAPLGKGYSSTEDLHKRFYSVSNEAIIKKLPWIIAPMLVIGGVTMVSNSYLDGKRSERIMEFNDFMMENYLPAEFVTNGIKKGYVSGDGEFFFSDEVTELENGGIIATNEGQVIYNLRPVRTTEEQRHEYLMRRLKKLEKDPQLKRELLKSRLSSEGAIPPSQ